MNNAETEFEKIMKTISREIKKMTCKLCGETYSKKEFENKFSPQMCSQCHYEFNMDGDYYDELEEVIALNRRLAFIS